jgi:hypothetical protein
MTRRTLAYRSGSVGIIPETVSMRMWAANVRRAAVLAGGVATGIAPAWPAWKTAPNAWSGASACGPSHHGAPPLTVVYRG